jgi:hypothetical protein
MDLAALEVLWEQAKALEKMQKDHPNTPNAP